MMSEQKVSINVEELKTEVEQLYKKIKHALKDVKDAVEDRFKAIKPLKDEIDAVFDKVKTVEDDALRGQFQDMIREAVEGPPLTPAELKAVDLDIERAIVELIKTKAFFGFVLTKLSRQRSNECPTMGVAPSKNNKIMLVYNPKFVKRLPKKERLAVLEHEVMHILNEHFLRQKKADHQRFNIACDIAINQYIDGLPESALKVPKGLEEKRESEYYYNSEEVRKMAAAEKFKQMTGALGDHSAWDKIASANAAEIEAAVRDLVKSAYEEAKKRDKGNMPAWMTEMIERVINRPIRWQNLIRRYIATEISPQQDITYRRPHRRRVDDVFPGFKREPLTKIFVAVDTSASMGSEDLAEVLNELCYLKKQHGEIEVIHCDTEVSKVEKFNGKNTFEFHGRGGTCFKPVLDYMAKKPFREGLKPTLIYFTDGYGCNPADEGYSKRFHTVWVLNRDGRQDRDGVAQFGKCIKMEEHRRG